MAVHDGHRDRLRDRFLENGLDSFTDIQVLELLLFYCIPRRDTNPIAHALLERFGSLSAVLDAPVSELVQVEGVGMQAAVYLHMIPEAGRYYQADRAKSVKKLTTLQSCADYLLPQFFGRSSETAILLCLDAQCGVIGCRVLSQGDAVSTELPVRKIVEQAIAANAVSVVLAHNHPRGRALPSQEDIAATRRVSEALRAIGVVLADHIIIAEEDTFSMVQAGLYQPGC